MESGRSGLRAVSGALRGNRSRAARRRNEILLHLAIGPLVGLLLALMNGARGNSPFLQGLPPYVAVGLSISIIARWADRLWSTTVAGLLGDPASWFGSATRLPFWTFGGGIALTLSLLILKNLGALDVRDIPVKPLFVTGELMGILAQAPRHILQRWGRM